MEVIVGRKGNQPFVITNKSVSSQHVKLVLLDNGKVLAEDLSSTNGTFVNGIRIAKKVIDMNTVVQLGTEYTFKVCDAISVPCNVNQPTSTTNVRQNIKQENIQEIDQEIIRKFALLEDIWTKYQDEKITLQKGAASKNFLRMLPMALLGGIGYLISCIPELSGIRIPITLIGLGIGGIITFIAYKSSTSLPEEMEKLNQKFQIDYVCPKCKQFLGFIPFEGLKNRGQCLACKTKWTKK